MSDTPSEMHPSHPMVEVLKDLEARAHRLANEIFNYTGDTAAHLAARQTRVELTKMLAPTRRMLGADYRAERLDAEAKPTPTTPTTLGR